MKFLDKYLQNVRIKKAQKYIRKNDIVLDIGSADGVMFEKWKGFIKAGFGIDPILSAEVKTDFYSLIPGFFPYDCPSDQSYDVITMLAVLEHIPTNQQITLEEHCFNRLNKNGRVIITVPSPRVDIILNLLKKLRLIDGMSLDEHFGFRPEHTTQLFTEKHFKIIDKKKFQFSLNNLFVFEKRF
jgi:hypothetical protein